MPSYIFYALLGAFLSGFYSFVIKFIAHKKYDVKLITIYSYWWGFVFALCYVLYQWITLEFSQIVLILAFINTLFYYFSILSRVESMKNIDSVIYFPIFKTLTPVMVALFSFFYLQESLNMQEFIWIVLWLCVPLWLLHKTENKRQKNLKRGVIFLLITSLLTLLSSIAAKQLHIVEWDVLTFLIISMFFWTGISLLTYKSQKKTQLKKEYYNKNFLLLWVIIGLLHVTSFYAFAQSLQWNLAIAFTINSFSILIPIVLSIFFFKEHFNLQKWFVIWLSILSMIFFI